jgi:methyl-accepting chemotaxis protein
VVRTSTSEVNRRLDQRHAVDIACRLLIGGSSSIARLADLSLRGALARDAPTASVGTKGTLTMDGVDLTLPFSVRSVQNGALHLAFELDAASTARLESVIERLSGRQAA